MRYNSCERVAYALQIMGEQNTLRVLRPDEQKKAMKNLNLLAVGALPRVVLPPVFGPVIPCSPQTPPRGGGVIFSEPLPPAPSPRLPPPRRPPPPSRPP